MKRLLCFCSFVLATITASSLYGQCQSSAGAKLFPKVPFQVTFEKKVTKLGYTALMSVPKDRMAVIENISVKGTHGSNAYLAIEVASSVGKLPQLVPQSPGYARHFLYAKRSGETVPLHIRETTKIYAGAETTIGIGVQSSAAIEPISVTVAGMYLDGCSLVP